MVNYAVVDTFAALADPKRVAIVERLASGDAAASTLARPLGLSLPAFAKHLKVLESAGLVNSRKQGRQRICSLSTARLGDVERWVQRRTEAWERSFDLLEKQTRRKR